MVVSLHTDFVSKVRSDASSVSNLARQRSLPGSRLLFSESGLRRAARLTAKRPSPATRSSTYVDEPVDVALTTESTLEAANGPKYAGKTAVVVGAGPAGSATAIHLARHGFTVKIFEKREDLRQSPVIGARSYSIGLAVATVKHMRDLGVDLPFSGDSGFVNGLHAFIGVRRNRSGGSSFDQDKVQTNRVLGSRQAISEALVNAVEKNCPENVELHFGYDCKDVSFPDQRVTFEDRNGCPVEVDCDLLVAADGAKSRVRARLLEYDKDFSISVIQNPLKYIGVPGLEFPDDSNIYSKVVAPGWVCFLSRRTPNGAKPENRGFMTVTMPKGESADVTFVGALPLFEQIRKKGKEWMYDRMPENFPKEWADKLRETIIGTQDVASLPSIVHVSTLIGPATVLMGDAAHAISPGLGFGCNLAVGDAKVLSEALTAADGGIAEALRIFNDMRHEEVNLCQFLEEMWNVNMFQLSGWKVVCRWLLMFHSTARGRVRRLIGQKSRPLVQWVDDEQFTAKKAVGMIKRDVILLLLAAVGVALFFLRAVLT